MSGWLLAGVDGSAHSRAALEWAAREATDRGAALRIVYVGEERRAHSPDGDSAAANRILGEAGACVRSTAPRVSVAKRFATGEPAQRLLALASGAEMIVVGGAGAGERIRRSELGSTVRGLVCGDRPSALAVIASTPRRVFGRVVLRADLPHPDQECVRYALEAARQQ